MEEVGNEPSCDLDDGISIVCGDGLGPGLAIRGEELCIELVFSAELLEDPGRFHESMSTFLDEAQEIIVGRDLVGLERAMLSSLVEHLRKWPYHEVLSARGYER